MQHSNKQQKQTQNHARNQSNEAAAGKQGAALAPPSYGMAFLDAAIDNHTSGQPLQLQSESQSSNGAAADAPPVNRTGLPDKLKAGIESLSGINMDHVRVHYNSDKPAAVNAHAYAQGSDIHLAAGQEQHLAHEAWHVVQQAQGRVRPTLQMKGGVPVNDDVGLEAEADVMGGRALGMFELTPSSHGTTVPAAQRKLLRVIDRSPDADAHSTVISQVGNGPSGANSSATVQRYSLLESGTRYSDGHQIMLLNSKSLWVQDGVLNTANDVLGRKGSFVKLVKTGISIESEFGGTLSKIAPAWNDERATTMPERTRLKRANTVIDGYTTHADCFMTAQTVMGVEDTALGSKTTTSPVVGNGEARTTVAPHVLGESAGPGSAFSTNSPTRSLQGFLDHAMPTFYAELKKDPRTELGTAFLTTCERTSTVGYLFAYRELVKQERFSPLLEQFSRQFGVNEYVIPEIGEGLAVINDPVLRNNRQSAIQEGEADADDELWNYHFAGVVMKDGDEYVTLENYSVGNDAVDNQQWLFQLYGTGKKSFHGEMTGKKGVLGGGSLTLGFAKS